MKLKDEQTYCLPNGTVLRFDDQILIDLNRTHSWQDSFGREIGTGIGYVPFVDGYLYLVSWSVVNGKETEAMPPTATKWSVSDLAECSIRTEKTDIKDWVREEMRE